MSEHVVHVTTVAGWDETERLVMRVYAEEDKSLVLVELPLGLSWNVNTTADQPPAWRRLTRRADVALGENGWVRIVAWSARSWPQPLARTRVRRSGQPSDGALSNG